MIDDNKNCLVPENSATGINMEDIELINTSTYHDSRLGRMLQRKEKLKDELIKLRRLQGYAEITDYQLRVEGEVYDKYSEWITSEFGV